MSHKVVLVANVHNPVPTWVDTKFANAGINYVYHECYNRQDLEAYAADADVVWFMASREGLVVEETMDVFPKLGAVVKCGSGTDNIDHAACTKRGIVIAHTPEDVTDPTSDHCIAMLFTAVRQTARQDRLVRQGQWEPRAALPIGRLSGADIGIIGFGRIGKAVVRKLAGFRMRVRVHDPYVDIAAIEAEGAAKVSLDDLLSRSQYVLVTCPLTAETQGLLGERELALMRTDSVLVNCARAGIVDETALAKALERRQIMAAALDVLCEHPLAPPNDLYALENVNFTPHMGGHPSNYPDALFINPVAVILELFAGHMPRWIANAGVIPKWHLTKGQDAEANAEKPALPETGHRGEGLRDGPK